MWNHEINRALRENLFDSVTASELLPSEVVKKKRHTLFIEACFDHEEFHTASHDCTRSKQRRVKGVDQRHVCADLAWVWNALCDHKQRARSNIQNQKDEVWTHSFRHVASEHGHALLQRLNSK
jgi:hypothetical protein